MKQLSKIMLAAVASVALAAPAFAWDFSASGTATASFNQTSVQTSSAATAKPSTIGTGVSSAGSSLTLASSHTDGPNTASLTYVLDWDGNLDETISVSGSKKVGNWTASGSVSYSPQTLGCSATDNGTAGTSSASAACAGTATGEDSTSVTLTDGTMTIVLGDAAHLSGQNVSASTGAAGLDGMDSAGADCAVGACVDAFHGVSLGYAISDTMSITVAYQQSADNGDLMGTGEFLDSGHTEVATLEATTHTTSGAGIGFSGTFGPATIGFTQMSASTADATGDTDAAKLSTSWSTMGLGVAIDLGDIDPFISYGTAEGSAGSANNAKRKNVHSGSEIGLTYALGSDTITVVVGSLSDQYDTSDGAGDFGTAGAADKPTEWSTMEVGYSTMIGPASLAVGYGTIAKTDGDGTGDGEGYSSTDLDVALSISF